jgi:hypothetical protein
VSKRSHDQFNTTIYGLNDRHRGSEMSGLRQGQLVDLTSHYKGETRVVKDFMVAPCNIRGLYRNLFPGGECARADQQNGGPQ